MKTEETRTFPAGTKFISAYSLGKSAWELIEKCPVPLRIKSLGGDGSFSEYFYCKGELITCNDELIIGNETRKYSPDLSGSIECYIMEHLIKCEKEICKIYRVDSFGKVACFELDKKIIIMISFNKEGGQP